MKIVSLQCRGANGKLEKDVGVIVEYYEPEVGEYFETNLEIKVKCPYYESKKRECKETLQACIFA